MARFLGIGSGKSGTIALGSYTQTWISCSGTSGSTSLSATGTFSPGDRLFIHQTRGTNAGLGEDNWVVSYSTGTVTLLYPLERDYADSGASQAQVAVVSEASSVTGSYTVPAWDGNVGGLFVMACSGTFSGTVTATGKGFRGGDAVGQASSGKQGEGYSAAGGTTSSSANTTGGGGGVYSVGVSTSGGGGGGYATSGGNGTSNPSITNGTGGGTAGQADLTTGIFLGGGGGSGAKGNSSTSSGAGGAGGGIIILYTRAISNTASLLASGANGSNGSGTDWAGAGGGAGGTVFIRSISTAIGTDKILASGGASGDSQTVQPPRTGGAGGDGRIRIETCSVTGTSTPSASTSIGGHSYCGTNIAIL